MRTVPAGCADVLAAQLPHVYARLLSCGRTMGLRAEIDLEAAAAALGAPAADLLAQYALRSQNLWGVLTRTGTSGGNEVLSVRRLLHEHVQVTGKAGRRDLNEVYDALAGVPGLDELVERACDPEPDVAALRRLAAAYDGTLTTRPGALAATVRLTGRHALPQLLGGLPAPAETVRELTFVTRQASWRDRRVRRLSRVDVTGLELWPAADDLLAQLAVLCPRAVASVTP